MPALANGNTFAVTYQKLIEIDPKGKESVFFTNNRQTYILAARKLPNGDCVLIDNDGTGTA